MHSITLGASDLRVTPVCLGTMTFGQQVDEAATHAILDRAVERGIDFIDTAEMYSVPARAETYGATETLIGRWFARRPGMRSRVVLASKVAGPSRNMPWVRGGSRNLAAADIVQACDDSLRRLQTDVIDLYQIHWPNRNAPSFGQLYFDPANDGDHSSVHEQLEALGRLVRAGKVRAVGLSNETPYGVAEFVHVAERHGLPRIASVQNPYCLINRSADNGLDEALHRHGVSLLAYSPLGFGLLTGKYDACGFDGRGPAAVGADGAAPGRLSLFESMRRQRWGRPEALATARLYNALAREHGLTPTRMALAWCYTRWLLRNGSTIIGVTSLAQLDENLDAWGTTLAPELLKAIDDIRWTHRDPAQ